MQDKIESIINSKDFTNFKVIFETGAAVRDVIVVFTQFWSPPVEIRHFESLNKKMEQLFQDLKEELTNDGLKGDEVCIEFSDCSKSAINFSARYFWMNKVPKFLAH